MIESPLGLDFLKAVFVAAHRYRRLWEIVRYMDSVWPGGGASRADVEDALIHLVAQGRLAYHRPRQRPPASD